MKQNRPNVDLGLVYSMYGGVGYPGYYMDAEASKELFRFLRYCFRGIWKLIKKPRTSNVEGTPVLQNSL